MNRLAVATAILCVVAALGSPVAAHLPQTHNNIHHGAKIGNKGEFGVRDADTTNSNPSSVSAIVRWTSLFGRKLQQLDVQFPGGSTSVLDGAVDVSFPGGGLRVNPAAVDVNFPGGSTAVQAATGAVSVNTPATTTGVQVANRDVGVTFPGGNVEVNPGSASVTAPFYSGIFNFGRRLFAVA